MGGNRQTAFGKWLRDRLEGEGKTVRGLARDIAERYPDGATIRNTETVRRALNKYLREGRLPSKPMRDAIADALGVAEDEMPEDGNDEPLTRDEAVELRRLADKAFRLVVAEEQL